MSTINSTGTYRLQGNAIGIAELAKQKPGLVIPATPEQVAELKRHDEQKTVRAEAVRQYAEKNPSKIFGQVVVNGEVIATVYDSGSARTERNIDGLKLTNDGGGTELAQKRLHEIVQASKGQIIYANFVSPSGPAPAVVANDAALPQITARGLNQMAREMEAALVRSRMIYNTDK